MLIVKVVTILSKFSITSIPEHWLLGVRNNRLIFTLSINARRFYAVWRQTISLVNGLIIPVINIDYCIMWCNELLIASDYAHFCEKTRKYFTYNMSFSLYTHSHKGLFVHKKIYTGYSVVHLTRVTNSGLTNCMHVTSIVIEGLYVLTSLCLISKF